MVGQTDKEKEQLVNSISGSNLIEYTENIAKNVRLSGTVEELASFHYVKKTLERFGLRPVLSFHDAYISLPLSAHLIVDGIEFPCITHSMSPSVDRLRGNLIYVNKKELVKEVISGNIVIIEGLATPGIVHQLTKHNAMAAIFINSEHTYEMIVSPVWGNPTSENVDQLPTLPVVSVNRKTGEELKHLTTTKSEITGVVTTEVDTRIRPIPTLTVDIKNEPEHKDYVLFSGHIDSWHYGAMDNGSANAVMLEVARILSEKKHNLKRNLRLAFWSGHSHGRYAGSTLYCDLHWEDIYKYCVMHVNIDSVGGKGANVLTQANCMAETKDIAKEVVLEVADQVFEGKRYGKAGDQSFWGTGVPSLFMGLSEQPPATNQSSDAFSELFGTGKSSGFGWWWHTTEDKVDKLDKDNLIRDCQVYFLSIYKLLTDDILPINQLAAIKDIENGIRSWQEKAKQHFDFSTTMQLLERLENEVGRLYHLIEKAELNSHQIQLINETLKKLSRELVPINYVSGSRFDYDVALQLPPVPSLIKINTLIDLNETDPEYFFIKTYLLRKRNEIYHSINEGLHAVQSCLIQLNK